MLVCGCRSVLVVMGGSVSANMTVCAWVCESVHPLILVTLDVSPSRAALLCSALCVCVDQRSFTVQFCMVM